MVNHDYQFRTDYNKYVFNVTDYNSGANVFQSNIYIGHLQLPRVIGRQHINLIKKAHVCENTKYFITFLIFMKVCGPVFVLVVDLSALRCHSLMWVQD